MGMTLWMQTLNGRTFSNDSDDHTMMYSVADELDAECNKLGVATLSSFLDTTDLELNMSESLDEGDFDEEPALDPETGASYGIDDMEWYDGPSGLATLTPLRDLVAKGWKPELKKDDRDLLLEELDDCIACLKKLPVDAKFNLAVIM